MKWKIKKYACFCIPQIWQILKCFTRSFHQALFLKSAYVFFSLSECTIYILFLPRNGISATNSRGIFISYDIWNFLKSFFNNDIQRKYFWLVSQDCFVEKWIFAEFVMNIFDLWRICLVNNLFWPFFQASFLDFHGFPVTTMLSGLKMKK